MMPNKGDAVPDPAMAMSATVVLQMQRAILTRKSTVPNASPALCECSTAGYTKHKG